MFTLSSDEYELKHDITKLKEYRENGIENLRAAKIFDRLKARRDEEKTQRHLLNDVLSHLQVSCIYALLQTVSGFLSQ